MKEYIKKRCLLVSKYFIENNSTIRDTAKHFDLSKSTIHLDITTRLQEIDEDTAYIIEKMFDDNIKMRSIRGGIATKKTWENRKLTW